MAPLSNLLVDNKRKAAAKKRARNVAQGGIGEESGGQDKECGEEEKENNNKDERRQPPTSMSLSLLHEVTRVEMAPGACPGSAFRGPCGHPKADCVATTRPLYNICVLATPKSM